MRITKRANIALRVLMYCAARPDQRITKTAIAEACNASEHHLGQIVNQLAQMGYLRTWRGRYGGIALGRPAREIRVGSVFREFESGVPIAECFAADTNTCPLVQACRLRSALTLAGQAFYQVLDAVTLHSLVENNFDLASLFSGEEPMRLVSRAASG
ncbi:Rrf2 family transcriptional regulator [Roseivivax halodurans JCM 10272]|uniref:Rrf2 family transcriptional regulator n=1 Tax=Roseivivax halodurans JCM 10272 TaxID=1449350 RepID=X7EJ70_9RHOB|nr:Rrf2 family transcriptional regulator [Roseivivax halodurans]ETX15208.1 Rrf2 family transcriptional regulator [Roseivivax halodurans JCM 10272]